MSSTLSGKEKQKSPAQTRPGGYAVSHAQKRLWVLEQMIGPGSTYNMPSASLLEGPLDVDALCRALTAIVARHESLRTTFAAVGDEVYQYIGPSSDFRPREIDLRDEPGTLDRVRELAVADAAEPFDLSTGPLLRASLIRLADQRFIFLFNIHHIVCDGWSRGIMVLELTRLYACFAAEQAPDLSELSIQYKDFASWQNRLLVSRAAQNHRAYWHGKLSGRLPLLNLPSDRLRSAVMTYNGAWVYRTLAHDVVTRLTDQTVQSGATLFMTLVAVLKTLLFRYTGQQ